MDTMTTLCKIIGRTVANMQIDECRGAVCAALYKQKDLLDFSNDLYDRVDICADFLAAFLKTINEYVEENI